MKWFFAETGGIGFVSFVYFILWRLNETRVICIGLSISNSFFFNLDKAVVAILSLPLLPPPNKINMTIENNHVLYRGYIFKSLDFFSIVMLVESGVFLFHFRSATKYFFLNVVLNLAFGVLLGDPFPSIQETMGALVILLSLSVFSEKRGRFVV